MIIWSIIFVAVLTILILGYNTIISDWKFLSKHYQAESDKQRRKAEIADVVIKSARRTEKDLREVVNPLIRSAGFHPPDLCQKDLAKALRMYDDRMQAAEAATKEDNNDT